MLLGLSLYLVKVVHDAPSFTFSDELVHAFNVEQIREHSHLFHHNPILDGDAVLPGLRGRDLGPRRRSAGSPPTPPGWSSSASPGLTLIGALFLLFERVGGSARTAGLAAAIYTTNFNFLFWGAQFSYESLALPLLVVVLLMLSEREVAAPGTLRRVGGAAGHRDRGDRRHPPPHLLRADRRPRPARRRRSGTSPATGRRRTRGRSPLLTAFLVASGWRWSPARPSPTSPTRSRKRSKRSATRSPASRRRAGSSRAPATPGRPRSGRGSSPCSGSPCSPSAGSSASARPGAATATGPGRSSSCSPRSASSSPSALRLAPAAWETGNRASEFFFIGLAFVVAGAGLHRAALALAAAGAARSSPPPSASSSSAASISGWPWDAQLAKPLRVSAEGRTISSPPLALAEWARREGPERQVGGGDRRRQPAAGPGRPRRHAPAPTRTSKTSSPRRR